MVSDAMEILLVEDNPEDAELTMRALRKNNLANKVFHVKDGEEALDYLLRRGKYDGRAAHDCPKMVLLDLKLPKVDGIGVLRRIKSDDKIKSIPVVVLTSSHEDRDLAECYRLGANSYIVKPVEFDNFIKAVTELSLYWMLLNKPPC